MHPLEREAQLADWWGVVEGCWHPYAFVGHAAALGTQKETPAGSRRFTFIASFLGSCGLYPACVCPRSRR